MSLINSTIVELKYIQAIFAPFKFLGNHRLGLFSVV